MKRYLSLDFLRGLTIFGMVFSAIIPYGVLPPWMYHIQNPPPSHSLNFTISGIGWVDLVFPIFIFCMGVAIPFSGASGKMTTKSIFTRFLMLWIFSYLYVFLDFSTAPGWLPQLATILGFVALFMLYLSNPKAKWIRYLGLALSLILIIIGAYFFEERISIYRSGIIIFLLAFIYLFGALIWLYTRDNHKLRFAIFLLILLFAIVTMHFSLQGKLYAIKEIRWFFNFEYIYFLLILIPATYIGDLLNGKIKSANGYDPIRDSSANPAMKFLMFIYLILYVIWMMIALYSGWGLLKVIITIFAAVIIWMINRKRFPEHERISFVAMLITISGALFLLYEGAITKVPCTVSYCFLTAGISTYLLMISDYITHQFPSSLSVRIFKGAGSNPLMSYIAFGAFVIPVFKLTGLIYIYSAAYPDGWPWIGVVRAAVAVIFTMALVAYLSERKIFWKA